MSRSTFPPTSIQTPDAETARSAPALLEAFRAVRRQTRTLAAPLEPEDFVVQSMPDASPVKWHLAHTTWFFETFVLAAALPGYQPRFPQYNFLFNSYYNSVGERIARDRRGLLSRPTIREVEAYRAEAETRLEDWLASADADAVARLSDVIILGLHHEQQHQELILTDLKHALASNPLRPIYRDREPTPPGEAPPLTWAGFDAGLRDVGHAGAGFAFDNEGPRHPQYFQPFALASRPSTNAEFLGFVNDGGYDRPELWLSDGWSACKAQGWKSPLYWELGETGWRVMTLAGMVELAGHEPATHLSFYEADAFARWSGARLPTEGEWEVAAASQPVEGHFLESGRYHPAPAPENPTAPLTQLFGDVWEWTRSPYSPYPGYAPAAGALGEYNGKFMCNQMVLRGGSCATPASHIRATYRNFFPPQIRWQFAGVRLARDER